MLLTVRFRAPLLLVAACLVTGCAHTQGSLQLRITDDGVRFTIVNEGPDITDLRLTTYPPPLSSNILLLKYAFVNQLGDLKRNGTLVVERVDFVNENGARLSKSKRALGAILANAKIAGQSKGVMFVKAGTQWVRSDPNTKWAGTEGLLLGPIEQARTFVRATPIVIQYSYGGGVLAAIGIASGAKFMLQDETTVVALASTENDVDKVMVDEDNERRIRVTLQMSPHGRPVATIVARYRPGGLTGAMILKSTIDELWESRYIYEGREAELGLGIPRVETYDLKSGAKVAETRNIKIMGDGTFSGEELCYDGNRIVYRSEFARHAGTGLLVQEVVREGILPRDYHHYELVLSGWPDSRRGGPW